MSVSLVDRFVETILASDHTARLVSGNKEIQMTCVFCNKRNHMYIKVPLDNQIPVFNCFKCGEHGLVNSRFLRDMNIYDIDLISTLVSYTKEISRTRNYRNLDDENIIFSLYNNYITQCQLSDMKLAYINKRLGLSLDYNDIIRNKIILNLYDLLSANNIDQYTRDPYIVEQLNNSFIGFISVDNAFINMRNLTPNKVAKSIDKRYINYNIFNKVSNRQRYYVIPNTIDITRPDPIKIHIAEGPFDILSILYNVNNNNLDHSLYASIGGKSYFNIIKYFIEFKGLFNIELHIYPDADIEDNIMMNIARYLDPYNISIYIHRNIYNGEKDFGVPRTKIKESVFKIGGFHGY